MVARKLREKDILFLGHLKRVFELLQPLRCIGTARDRSDNRRLFFDDYCKLILLYTWNPLLESIHDLQQAASLPTVAKTLGVRRFSAGSFSESVRLFDPEELDRIIEELAGQLPADPPSCDPRFKDLKHALTAVDGTVLRALARLAKAAAGIDARYNTSRNGQAMYGWRLHTQLDLETFRVRRMDRTGARNAKSHRENNVLRQSLSSDRCYLCDGGFDDRQLLDDIIDARSSYVIRGKSNDALEVLQERPLSLEALDGGVVRDTIVRLRSQFGKPTTHPLRRIELQVTPHQRRLRSGMQSVDRLVLYTSLLELPAELIGVIYRQRYTVELFFRMLKQLLGLRHLLSQREEGLDIQIRCALIVCLLIQLISGKKPTKAMRNMIGFYLLGWAEAEEVVAFLNKPDNTGIKKKAKDELWKKLGVN